MTVVFDYGCQRLAGGAHLHPAIGGGERIRRGRLTRAQTFGLQPGGVDALADQRILDRDRAGLGQTLITLLSARSVGVTDDQEGAAGAIRYIESVGERGNSGFAVGR